MFARIGRVYRAILYGSNGTLSLGRLLVLFGVVQVALSVWLFIVWIWYVTATGQMEAASSLATSIGTILSSVLSSQVVGIAATWWTTKRYGASGSATPEMVNDPSCVLASAATEVVE